MTQDEITSLFDQYHNMVYRLALTELRSIPDAEDVTQSVFLKLLSGCPSPAPGRERAWLATVTINACRDWIRSFWRHRTEPLDESISFSAPEESALFEAVMALPERYRVVLYLHYYEGYTYSEIAEMLQVKQSTISMRMHRARSILRKKLQEEHYETLVSANL